MYSTNGLGTAYVALTFTNTLTGCKDCKHQASPRGEATSLDCLGKRGFGPGRLNKSLSIFSISSITESLRQKNRVKHF
jgi:hypothetical protein